ncbi:MAG: hypothetical protein ICV81_17620 [Flavisolibacter sp.]|nr:hypothetical protein [Flavisolibacter sp.]
MRTQLDYSWTMKMQLKVMSRYLVYTYNDCQAELGEAGVLKGYRFNPSPAKSSMKPLQVK